MEEEELLWTEHTSRLIETFNLLREQKKYKLTDDVLELDERVLYRIEALISFDDVKAGDRGGFIESESNLSQDGNAWIYDSAMVCGFSKVGRNAKVHGTATLYHDVEVFGNSEIYGKAMVCEDAKVCGNAKVYGDAEISGRAIVCGDAEISGFTKIGEQMKVCN